MNLITHKTAHSLWIDAGKALGILLVVACHNPYIQIHQREIFSAVMSFHVPLFFALSGATISELDTWRKTSVRFLSLIWVYIVAASVSLPLVMLRPDAAHAELFPIVLGILYGTGHTMHPGPLWFLPCLALSIPVAWSFLQALHLFRLDRRSIYILSAVLGLCLALVNTYLLSSFPRTMVDTLNWGDFEHSGAFWSADLVLLGTGFMLIGWSLSKALRNTPAIWGIGCTILLVIAMFFAFSPSTNIDSRVMQPSVGATLVATAGIASVFLLLRLLKKCPGWILMIGAATLPILVMHQFLQKKLIIFLSGSLSSVTLLSFILSLALAVGLPTVLDRFFFRNSMIGRFIFYPRSLLEKRN